MSIYEIIFDFYKCETEKIKLRMMIIKIDRSIGGRLIEWNERVEEIDEWVL